MANSAGLRMRVLVVDYEVRFARALCGRAVL